MEVLIETLRNDWEFQFTVNYYLREAEYTDKPFKELDRRIKKLGR